MVNYQNGKIYALRSNKTDEIYIGSTAENRLSDRMSNHRRDYKNYLLEKRNYITCFEILKYDDCYIELIEECPCKNRMELERREGQVQREMECVNKIIAGRTQKEYYDDNKDKILEQKKQYHTDNIDKIKERRKKDYIDNREKILQKNKEWRDDNKEKILQLNKKWRYNNIDKVKEINKKKYNNNKDKLLKKMTCECGCVVANMCMKRHQRSKKHISLLNNK